MISLSAICGCPKEGIMKISIPLEDFIAGGESTFRLICPECGHEVSVTVKEINEEK